MAESKTRAAWPVLVFVMGKVHQDAQRPIDADEGREAERGSIAAKHFVVQRQSQNAERDDRSMPAAFQISAIKLNAPKCRTSTRPSMPIHPASSS